MKILVLAFFLSINVFAGELIQLENTWNLFSQKLGPDFSLPVPLNNRSKLLIQFEIPANDGATLRKVFSQVSEIEGYKAIFEIYYFNQNSQKYLSQQVYLFKDGQLVTRCASYFGLEQKFLVPGSCAGVADGYLYGVAIYK